MTTRGTQCKAVRVRLSKHNASAQFDERECASASAFVASPAVITTCFSDARAPQHRRHQLIIVLYRSWAIKFSRMQPNRVLCTSRTPQCEEPIATCSTSQHTCDPDRCVPAGDSRQDNTGQCVSACWMNRRNKCRVRIYIMSAMCSNDIIISLAD